VHLCVEGLQRKTDTLNATFTSCLYAFERREYLSWYAGIKLVLVLDSRRAKRNTSVFLMLHKACLYVAESAATNFGLLRSAAITSVIRLRRAAVG